MDTPAQQPPELRPVPGWPGLFVGKDGSAWSSRMRRGRLRRLDRATRKGRLDVNLAANPGAKDAARRKVALFLAPLVLEAFTGPKPAPGFGACHLDGDPSNNAVENLKWATRSEIARRRQDRGPHAGKREAVVKLLAQDPAASDKSVAARAGCCSLTVGRVRRELAAAAGVAVPLFRQCANGRVIFTGRMKGGKGSRKRKPAEGLAEGHPS